MRVFKTKWFAREARSHAITDEELCRAILETEQGKADVLGGGVFKSAFTEIVSVQLFWRKGKQLVLHVFICKTDMSNINSQELAGFRELVPS